MTRILLALIGLVSTAAAQTGPPPPAPPPPPERTIDLDLSAPALHLGAPDRSLREATDAEVLDAASRWEAAAYADDAAELNGMVHSPTLLLRALDGRPLSETFRQGMAIATGMVGTPLHAGLGTSGSYTFLRLVERDGAQRAQFRYLGEDGGLNYQEVLFQIDEAGTAWLVDLHSMANGEDLSRSLGRMLNVLVDDEGETTSAADLVSQFTQAHQQGDAQRMVDLYPRLPVSDADRQPLALLYVMASAELGTPQFLKATDHYVALYGQNAAVALLLIDRHYLAGDYEAMMVAIDDVAEVTGGDPYLDLLRSSGLLALDRPLEAMKAIDRAHDALPEMDAVHTVRANVGLAAGAFEAVRDELVYLESERGWTFEPATIAKEWPAFAASPAFAEWIGQTPSDPKPIK